MVKLIEHAYGSLRDAFTHRPVSGHMFLVAHSDYAAAVHRIAALEANLAAVKEALEEIQGKGSALRQGGPDPVDLHDLSDALEEATDLAAEALSALEATPPAPKVTEADWRKIYDKLAEEGGGTWATYMMMEIAAAYGDHELAPEAALTASEAK